MSSFKSVKYQTNTEDIALTKADCGTSTYFHLFYSIIKTYNLAQIFDHNI